MCITPFCKGVANRRIATAPAPLGRGAASSYHKAPYLVKICRPGGGSACRETSTRFSKMQAFLRGDAARCVARAQRVRLRAEKCFFRRACRRKKQIQTLFCRLRAAKLCRGLFLVQSKFIFLHERFLFQQSLPPGGRLFCCFSFAIPRRPASPRGRPRGSRYFRPGWTGRGCLGSPRYPRRCRRRVRPRAGPRGGSPPG